MGFAHWPARVQPGREGFGAVLPDHLPWLQSPNEGHGVLRNDSLWIGSQKFTFLSGTAYSKLISL